MARGLAIRRYEVSELQRLNLRKRGRWLVGLELFEGVSKLKRALARRSILQFHVPSPGNSRFDSARKT